MLLGLGRGPPGRGPPGRAAVTRAPRRTLAGADAALAGPAGRAAAQPSRARPGLPGGCRGDGGAAPMPVAVELKGLLPGRGPGRGTCR